MHALLQRLLAILRLMHVTLAVRGIWSIFQHLVAQYCNMPLGVSRESLRRGCTSACYTPPSAGMSRITTWHPSVTCTRGRRSRGGAYLGVNTKSSSTSLKSSHRSCSTKRETSCCSWSHSTIRVCWLREDFKFVIPCTNRANSVSHFELLHCFSTEHASTCSLASQYLC